MAEVRVYVADLKPAMRIIEAAHHFALVWMLLPDDMKSVIAAIDPALARRADQLDKELVALGRRRDDV